MLGCVGGFLAWVLYCNCGNSGMIFGWYFHYMQFRLPVYLVSLVLCTVISLLSGYYCRLPKRLSLFIFFSDLQMKSTLSVIRATRVTATITLPSSPCRQTAVWPCQLPAYPSQTCVTPCRRQASVKYKTHPPLFILISLSTPFSCHKAWKK